MPWLWPHARPVLVWSIVIIIAMCATLSGPSAASSAFDDEATPCNQTASGTTTYDVIVTQRDAVPSGAALISHVNGSAQFNFTFSPSWFPLPANDTSSATDGLVIRCVECNPNHHSCAGVPHPQWTNAGALAFVRANLTAALPRADYVAESDVQWPGCDAPAAATTGTWGAADVRIVYRPPSPAGLQHGLYYLAWDNCTHNCEPTRTTLLSTSPNPLDPNSWTLHGPVLPGAYTAGASLLFRDDAGGPPHYAFVADSNTANALLLATSTDGLHWNNTGRVLMAGRPACWDKAIAAGPPPVRLSTGDYLYIYNIDTGYPYHPNPLGRCSIGWAILDGEDPTRIVARAPGPLLTPNLPWEQCEPEGYTCQQPMVVFATGIKPLGGDEFLLLYGAADTNVGMVRIRVDSTKNRALNVIYKN